MNKEKLAVIESITENIETTIKLAKKLNVDKNLKRQLVKDLTLSYVNLEELGSMIKF